MYAMIENSGRQYKVSKGDVVFFEKLNLNEGDKVNFDKVILVSDDNNIQIGNPYVKGAKVEGKVVSNGKHKKVIVYKMKPKKGYRRKQGHRQPYTKVEIMDITSKDSKTEPKVEKEVKETKPEAKTEVKAEVKTGAKAETKSETKAVKTSKPKTAAAKTTSTAKTEKKQVNNKDIKF